MEFKSQLINHQSFVYLKNSIEKVSKYDHKENFRVKMIEYINDTANNNEDKFFYDHLEYSRFLNPYEDPSCADTVAYTSGEDYIVRLNSPGIIGEDIREWDFIYCHECLHLLWETHNVEEKIIAEKGSCDHFLLNIASDCVINDYLYHWRNKKKPSGLVDAEYIKSNFGVVYDRNKDTQYSLYLKCLPVAEKMKNDKQLQQQQQQQDGQQGGQGGQQGGQQSKGQSGQQGSSSSSGGNQSNKSPEQQAQDAAAQAQNAADKAKEAANNDKGNKSKQDAANKSQNAADKAKDEANKASDAAKNGDEKGAKQHADAAKKAAQEAKDAAKEAGATGLDGNNKSSEQQAKDAAAQAQNAADKAKEAANNDKGNKAKQDAANKSQKAADKAKDEANKAEEAAKNGDKKGAKQHADAAKKAAQEAKDAAKEAGAKGVDNDNSDGNGMPGDQEQTEVDQLEEANMEDIIKQAKDNVKRYQNRVAGYFGDFMKKCRSSVKLEPQGLSIQTVEKNSSWNEETGKLVHSYVKSRITKFKKKYKKSYRRVKRGSGFVEAGQPIMAGKERIKNSLIINAAFYIDRSGSMSGARITNVFDACYTICDALTKQFGRDAVVNKTKYDIYAFNMNMVEVEYGKRINASGGTMDFDKILQYIAEETNKYMINIVITDGEMNVSSSEVLKFAEKISGMVIFISLKDEPTIRKLAENQLKGKLFFLEADAEFKLK